MASFTRNWGLYTSPLEDITRQTYLIAEGSYSPRWAAGWQAVLALGFDHGGLIGNSFGAQFTLRKTLTLKP